MTVDLSLPPAPKPIQYHMLAPTDPEVLARVPVWVNDPVAFCIEAMNWHPHWYQQELLRDQSYFLAACWSRQIGKSEAIAHKAIWTAFCKPEADVIIIAPGRRQAQELYRKILKALTKSPLVNASVVKATQEKTEFTNMSQIINLPAGDEGVQLRGYSIALLIIEEAAFIPASVFVAVEQGLSATGGKEIMISTPRGKHNEFYRAFFPDEGDQYDMSKTGRQQVNEWSCYRHPYSVALDVFKPDGSTQLSEMHVDRQKRKMEEWKFRAEYMAEFIEDIDQYFAQHIIEQMFNQNFVKLEEPVSGGSYFFGIDIAKGGDMTSVCIVERIDTDPIDGHPLNNPHVRIVGFYYWKMGGIEQQYPYILALTKLWTPVMIWFDRTSIGERPFEELQQTYKLPIEGVTMSGPAKVELYGNLTLLMTQSAEISGWNKRLQSYHDQEAKRQFEELVYEITSVKTSTGGIREGINTHIYAGRGHDDIPDSVALACRCVAESTNKIYVDDVPKVHLLQDGKRDTEKRITEVMGIALSKKEVMRHYRRSGKVFW